MIENNRAKIQTDKQLLMNQPDIEIVDRRGVIYVAIFIYLFF